MTHTDPIGVDKAATGIPGLDEITSGGLPRGRPTLVVGGAGSGKTVLAMQFLANGALHYDEPGVFVTFEETTRDLITNFATLGYDLDSLCDQRKLAIDYVYVEPAEIEETGEYDLEGLFIRLGHAVDSIGAKRVVVDTIEVLFSGLRSPAILRAELRRLFRWLKERGLTAVVTGERGDQNLTRYGLEEYVADCVIILDHRVTEQVSTRRLRIAKYRGSAHGTNEYPFLIQRDGISVLPITSIGLAHTVADERVSSGVEQLDEMLGGRGYYRGSSILVSGTAGTGKSSLAASFVKAACDRGESAVYIAYEESPSQIIRNMRSVGIDLQQCMDEGLLVFRAERPTSTGLEAHLAQMIAVVRDDQPAVVVIDPVSNLTGIGDDPQIRSVLTRIIDYLKSHQITSLFTSLTRGGAPSERTDPGVSSLMDTWIVLRDTHRDSERIREINVLKSRGMPHSNKVREFALTNRGIEIDQEQ